MDRPPTRHGKIPSLAPEAIERAALHYLERYASSRENLRRVLMRRVQRAALAGDADTDAGKQIVDALIARYAQSGLLDDKRYAELKAAGLVRAGSSRYKIRGKLMQKGVPAGEIDDAIAGLDEDQAGSERAAACALIRRRHLGPYRAPAERAKFRDKDLATLARAGFGLTLARRLLRAPDGDTLEAWARGADDDSAE